MEALGAGLAFWARRTLGSNWSGRIAFNENHLLRHPIYSGFFTMRFGAALVTGERLAVPGLILVVFAYWRKIRLEEANLRFAFGAEYDAYRGKTWALIPGFF